MYPRKFQSAILSLALVFAAGHSRAFSPNDVASAKASYLAGDKVDAPDGSVSPDAKNDIAQIQGGEVPDAEFDMTAGRAADALKLSKDEARQAHDLYRRRGATRHEKETLAAQLKNPKLTPDQKAQLTARLDALAARLKSRATDDGLPEGGVTGKSGGRTPTPEELAQLASKPRGQSSVKLDASQRPPAVLADIAMPPQGTWDRLVGMYVLPNSKTGQVITWLARRPTDEEQRDLVEGYDYYHANTTAGGAMDDLMRPAVEDGTADFVRMNYAKTPNAYGVTIPVKGTPAARNQGQETSVTLSEDLKGAPVEVRALVLGHEVGVHAVDEHSGFLDQPGSHIPSELRAFVMDGKNYLELRAKMTDERLKQLKTNPVWQQADMKARVLLGIDIPWTDYKDSAGNSTASYEAAKQVDRFRREHPTATPGVVARQYISKKYGNSGETGLENITKNDDSPVGQYNNETDRMINALKKEDYPSMDYGF
jgi:hypothetical protein